MWLSLVAALIHSLIRGVANQRQMSELCGAAASPVRSTDLTDQTGCAIYLAPGKEKTAMPRFEVFTRRSAPVVKEPMVTIQKKGMFSLNRASYEALGEPEAVELLYDPTERIIGLRPTDPSTLNAYPVRTMGNAATRLIAGTAFTRFYEIPTAVARRFSAEMHENILTIDLKKGGVEVTGPGRPRREK